MQTQEKKFDFGRSQTSLPQRQAPQQQPRAQAQPRSAPAPGGPLKAFRSGAIQVTIWENETLSPEGQVQSYKTVSFERRYKDKAGEWKSSNSLRVNDLPKAALMLNKAYEYLVLTGSEDNDESY